MATLRKITLNWEIRTGAITCDTGYIKRQELCDVDLYVTVDGTAYALDTSWALNLSVKPTLLGDNAALIAVTTWTASATTGLYQATAQTMGGTALDTYLAANNSDTTDDEGNKLVDLDVYYTISTAVKSKSDTVTLILKPDVGRADDTVPATIIARNDFLVTNGTGLLVNVAAGYAANGAFVAAQASLAITNATNYIEVTAAGVASVNTTAFTAGSYPLATVVASAGAITSNTDLRAWITPKPAAGGGVTSITGTANEITVTGTTTPTLSLPSALTFTAKTITGGTFASPTLTTPTIGDGTESAPSLSFASDTNTGVYRPAADTVGIVGGGNDVVRMTGIASATDYLEIKNGIGVGSPIHVLAEGGSANIGVHLQPKGSGLFTISDGTDFNKGIRFRSSSSAASAITLLDAVSTAGRVVTLPDATGTLALVSGDLGTPSAIVLTNASGTAASLTAGTVTTNANLTGHVTSTGNAAVLGSFTMAQLSAAVSDGDPAYVGAANTFTAANTFNQAATFASGIHATKIQLGATAGAAIGIDIVPLNSPTQPIAGRSWMRVGGGSSEYLMINAGLTGGYVDICQDLGSGVRVWDGTGGHVTYLTAPATGTLRVTTNGSTLGTVDAATFTGNAATVTKWTTGRTIALTGDVTYTSGALDGSGNVTGTATLAATSNTSLTSLANLVTVGTLTGGATGAGFTVALSTSTVTGTLADARLSANVPLKDAANTFTAANTISTAGATSLPAMKFSGVPFAGTGTTSFPLVYINDANATASTTLNTAGTYLGVNGDGTQDLMNLLKDGVSQFKVDSGGNITAKSRITFGSTGQYIEQGGGNNITITAPGNLFGFTNAAQSIGGTLDTATDGVWKFKTRGGGSDAAITASSASFSTTLGVTGATTLTGNLTSNGALISTPQALTGAGAVNVTTLTTAVTTTAPAQALTLANGTNGQIKTIVHQALSGGGTWVLTPTTKTGYTTITSTAVGETCTLQFFTTIGWCILSLRGAIAA